MPSSFGAKVLLQLSEEQRPDILKRAVNMKDVSPKAASIIENRVMEMIGEMEAERNSAGPTKIAEVMNELDKPQVDTLLASLESLSTESAKKVRPKIFLFDDVLYMPQRSRVQLFNDVSTDIITMALRGSTSDLRESVLASIGARVHMAPCECRLPASGFQLPASSFQLPATSFPLTFELHAIERIEL